MEEIMKNKVVNLDTGKIEEIKLSILPLHKHEWIRIKVNKEDKKYGFNEAFVCLKCAFYNPMKSELRKFLRGK